MKITVFGSGYVGLVQAAVLAEFGHDVLCVDIDEAKVEGLKKGHVPIFEPGLEELVAEGLAAGTLRFTTDPREGVSHGYVQFIAVGTPPGEDGSADLAHVLAVARTLGEHMERDVLVANKSTVPVGTSDRVREAIGKALAARGRADLAFEVVSNPEFLKEGSAVADCMRPDRIIVGTRSRKAEEVMRELYAPLNRNHDRVFVMDERSAELTKYAANCMLATKISFMNEIAALAERLGADIEQVRLGIGSDPRIGYQFIYPGLGYGGSCFPKDIRALIRTAEDIGFDASILRSVEARNEDQKSVLFRKVVERFGEDLTGHTFALWGLAFKPNTNDMREAPSRVLMEALWKAGASVQVFDPEAMDECQAIYGQRDDLVLCGTREAALKGADALLIATEWKVFRAPPFETVKQLLKQPVIIDGRNLYAPDLMRRHQIEYHSIGRAPVVTEDASRIPRN
jgi:UDPglucose 6-dehydrogenase